MKVTGPTGPQSAMAAKGAKAPASGGASFSPLVSGAGAAGPASASAGVASVGGLQALLALQEVGSPLERRQRAMGRASRLLDVLDDLKLGLIDGQTNPATLQALMRGLREQRSATDDAGLEGVLDQIETRAAVELAKLEMARAAT